ncbi:MAG: ABC transporter permease, partial [Actinomycetota bacterium]
MFWVLVLRQLKLWGKRSWMGTLWPVASPFFLTVLFVFVFRRVFQVPIERYPEYLLCGLLPWTFLSQVLGRTIASISTQPELIRKAPFRYELIPLSSAAAHGLNFLLTVAVFVAYLALEGHLPYDTLPLLVFPVLATILLAMSLSMLVALIDVYNHDLQLV